jgi:hypothetical protein
VVLISITLHAPTPQKEVSPWALLDCVYFNICFCTVIGMKSVFHLELVAETMGSFNCQDTEIMSWELKRKTYGYFSTKTTTKFVFLCFFARVGSVMNPKTPLLCALL